jgi:hypothetical protein
VVHSQPAFTTVYISRNDRAHAEVVAAARIAARIAALMQVLAPEAPAMREGLVKYMASVSHVNATKALARLAIFSAEDEVRQAALDALKVRRERDYTEILLQGLHYPLPAVAKRASEAVVKLERSDLIPQLVDLLDEPDPRAPVRKEVNGKEVPDRGRGRCRNNRGTGGPRNGQRLGGSLALLGEHGDLFLQYTHLRESSHLEGSSGLQGLADRDDRGGKLPAALPLRAARLAHCHGQAGQVGTAVQQGLHEVVAFLLVEVVDLGDDVSRLGHRLLAVEASGQRLLERHFGDPCGVFDERR